MTPKLGQKNKKELGRSQESVFSTERVAIPVNYGTKSSLSEGETMGGGRARSVASGSHPGPGLPRLPRLWVYVFMVATFRGVVLCSCHFAHRF